MNGVKSHRLNWKFILVLAVILLLVGGFICLGWPNSVSYVDQKILATNSASAHGTETPAVLLGDLEIPVELAVSYAEIQRGLSGRVSLAEDKGLLFIFSRPAIYRFWMPDMNFPIDIIWINEGKIIGINHNVSNDFDPDNPIFYYAPKPAQYVLEVNAGFAEQHGLDVGDNLIFKNINIK